MKILVFADVHGALNSLNALVKTQDWQDAGKRIFLGDVCFGRSRPDECIKMLSSLDCVNILGNNDLFACDHVPHDAWAGFNEVKRKQLDYMKKHISDENKKFVMLWQKELTMKIGDKSFYFTHYPWKEVDGDENVVENLDGCTIDARQKMFSNIDADYVIFGHEHIRSNCSNGKQYFHCVGALSEQNPGNYLMINIDGDRVDFEDKFLYFDFDEEIELMDKAGYPYDPNRLIGD